MRLSLIYTTNGNNRLDYRCYITRENFAKYFLGVLLRAVGILRKIMRTGRKV
jgi:hypothetical protein